MKQTASFSASAFYLLYLFPAGIIGFVVAVAGLALSIGLMPIFAGFPLLLAWTHGIKSLTSLDSRLARRLLSMDAGAEAATTNYESRSNPSGLWRQLSAQLSDSATYTALLWQICRLPIGIVSFTITVAVIAVELALLLSPIVYWVLLQSIQINIFEDQFVQNLFPVTLTPLQISFLYVGIGLLLLPVAVKLIRNVAHTVGLLAIEMDSPSRHAPYPPKANTTT